MEENQKLRVDKEFKLLTTPLGHIDYMTLEEDIVDNGCKEPITVWNDIIINGTKRYEICFRWDIPFEVREIKFRTRDDAIHYICREELRKEKINEEKRKYLIGKLFLSALSITNRKKSPCRLYLDTSKEGLKDTLAQQFSFCKSTISKYARYSKYIDKIWRINTKFGLQILSGRIKLAHPTMRFIYELTGGEINFLYDYICEKHIRHLEEKDVRRIIEINFFPKKKKTEKIMIKQMPKYDPDAEISSLLLTIPTWISSIERTKNISDLQKITLEARIRAIRILQQLEEAISIFKETIEEGF